MKIEDYSKKIIDKRINGVEIAFRTNKVVITKPDNICELQTVTTTKLTFSEAVYLRDMLIQDLADMGEPVYFDSEYVCTHDLLECYFEEEHDCS